MGKTDLIQGNQPLIVAPMHNVARIAHGRLILVQPMGGREERLAAVAVIGLNKAGRRTVGPPVFDRWATAAVWPSAHTAQLLLSPVEIPPEGLLLTDRATGACLR